MILVVDDNEAGRYATVRMLKAAGFDVVEARTGHETLEKARQKPDLIVLDINLPDINGIEVCKRLKADPETRHIPVLHLTATYLNLKDKIAGLESGADGYLTHPFEPAELIATIKSLLRLKKAEEETLQEALNWQTTFDAINDAIFLADAEGRILRSNKAFKKLINKPEHEIIGNHCYELVHGTRDFFNGCPFLRARRTKQKETMEFEDRGKWFSVAVDPILNESGEIEKFVHIISDITVRVKSEKALSESEKNFRRLSQEFQAVLDAIPDSIMRQDKDLKILWSNKVTADIFGKKPEDILGQSCYKLWHDRESACDPCPVIESFKTGKPANLVVTTPDGRIWDLRVVPLIDEKGTVGSVIELARDITKHRRLEEQLRHAQKMDAIGTLAGGIAHDFNNILNVILGYGDLIMMQLKSNDPLMPQMREILSAAERGSHLAKSLLTFSRKQPVEIRTVRINEIVEGFKKLIKRIIGEDIDLKINYSKEDLLVNVDRVQIEQVLMNLAVNARDAMPRGGLLKIETSPFMINEDFVKVRGYGKPGMYALITVSDTGIGMDEATKERIFEPYFTTKELGKGTGLGLSIVYGIIRQHEGYIDCDSELGKGTTFRIYLPLAEQEIYDKSLKVDYPKGGTETILIAEDDENVRSLIKTTLKSFGYKVIEAINGKEVVEKFEENKEKISLLILDMIMPCMTGKEAYDAIKKQNADTKVIFLSGYPRDVLNRYGFEARSEFLQKPVLPMELLRKIREIIDKKSDRI